jgi:hypothetical protein
MEDLVDDKLLEKLGAIDLVILTDVVRQDQRSPSFEITKWTVKRLSDKGIANPDGLWLYSGLGNNGKETQAWSVVLKILNRQLEEPPADDLWYWKREFLLAQSGFTKSFTEQVKAPRYYHMEETSDGAWIWMEYVEDSNPGKWTLNEYAFAARQLGCWNSRYLTGTPLPTDNWLTRQHYRTWLRILNLEEDWKFQLHQKHISKNARDRYELLWKEREIFFELLENLPQVFSHYDCQRRNLSIRLGKDRQQELIVLDWAQCGIGAIGTELNWLIGMSAALFEWGPSDLQQLDTVAFQNYVQGVQEGGWSGDANILRLGYTTMLALFFGCTFPAITIGWCLPENKSSALQQFNLAGEELYVQWLPLFDYSLDCADEARSLMKKLRFSN